MAIRVTARMSEGKSLRQWAPEVYTGWSLVNASGNMVIIIIDGGTAKGVLLGSSAHVVTVGYLRDLSALEEIWFRCDIEVVARKLGQG